MFRRIRNQTAALAQKSVKCPLMDQKREISLPVGYKTAKPKQETRNDCDVISDSRFKVHLFYT